MTTTSLVHHAPRVLTGQRAGSARALIAVLAALSIVLTVGGIAFAGFTTTGTGTGSATTGTLNPPTAVAGVQLAGVRTVSLSWNAPTGPAAATGYYVLRTASSGGATTAACGTTAIVPTTSTSCEDTAVPAGDMTYVVVALFQTWTSTSAPSAVVNVLGTTQSITFVQPNTPALTLSVAVLSRSSTSGLPVTVTSSDTSVCTVSGNLVAYHTAGTCTLTATQAGNANYDAGTPVVRTVLVGKSGQTISFTAPASPALVGAGAALVATATSGLVVTFTTPSLSTICTVSGTTVTYVGAGTCSIQANQAGNATYSAATQAQKTVVITKAIQTITFAQPPNPAAAGTSATLTATSTSGLPVTFVALTPTICTITDGDTVNYLSPGHLCLIGAEQTGNASYDQAQPVQRSVIVTAPS